jgi:hypothetical protein
VVKYTIYVLGIIGISLLMMIGLLFWVLATGLDGYTIIWCIIFLVFVVGMVVLFYVWGKGRIREEKRLIV